MSDRLNEIQKSLARADMVLEQTSPMERMKDKHQTEKERLRTKHEREIEMAQRRERNRRRTQRQG